MLAARLVGAADAAEEALDEDDGGNAAPLQPPPTGPVWWLDGGVEGQLLCVRRAASTCTRAPVAPDKACWKSARSFRDVGPCGVYQKS